MKQKNESFTTENINNKGENIFSMKLLTIIHSRKVMNENIFFLNKKRKEKITIKLIHCNFV